jgi:DNA-directed RNA polymerase subunit RPC12/RpoP
MDDMMKGAGINITLNDATDVVCEKCGSRYFKEVYAVKKFSKLLIGADSDKIVPINVLACAECGHINKEFEVKESAKKEKPNNGLII